MAVIVGNPMDADALIYGRQHPGTLQYLEENIQRLGQQMSTYGQTLTDAGRQFYERAQTLYQQFNSDEALRAADQAMRRVKSYFQDELILPLHDLGSIQNASLIMQRWVMAEPSLRQMYHQQQCDGYSDTYVDLYPGQVGEQHYDWRRVHEGLVVADPEDPEDYKVEFFFDDMVAGDRELTLQEQMDITSTWDFVKSYVKAGKDDPSSNSGGMF